jgi:hypothetical protein
MISDTINSSVLIHDIIDRYNIQSSDFATRTPDWIVSAMKDIGVRSALKTDMYMFVFNNNRVLLPKFCETIDMVLINNHKVDYAESMYIINTNIELNRNLRFLGDPTQHNFNNEIISASFNGELDPDFSNGNNQMFYRIDNGWLHTNVRYGTIEIKYKHLPNIMDEMFGIQFPIIPDGHHTKEAIMWFILRTILMRGYIHPILNLKENSPFTNPAIAYKQERLAATIELSSPNRDSREKWIYPMSALFGKRKPLWIKQDIIENLEATPSVRWIADGPSSCEVESGFHTGWQLVPKKKQVKVFDEWQYTDDTRVDRIYNIIACPLLYTRAGYSVGLSGFASPTYLTFNAGVHMGINIPPTAGYNYIYVSIPVNKTFSVIDNNSVNISSEFELIGQDNTEGYVDCNIHRSINTLYTELGFEFILIIE